MTDLLGIGSAGVRAMQAALTVTGDNVANAETPGYTRRSIHLATASLGNGVPWQRLPTQGAGVGVDSIGRATDAFKTDSARVANSNASRLTTRADWLTRLQSALGDHALNDRLGGFYDAATALASGPTSTAARTIFLDRADQAATAFRETGGALAGLQSDIGKAADAGAAEVNGITAGLADINAQLRRTASGSEAANGLLDSRDRLLGDLAQRLWISVTEGASGTVEVRLGTGAAAALLVPKSGDATRIGVRDGPSGAEIVLDPTHAATVIRLPASGSLAGLIEAGRQVKTASDAVDALAQRFAGATNTQHAVGADALGNPGGALFATRTVTATPGRANAGSAPVDVTAADTATLFPDGYRLLRSGGAWTLSRADGSGATTGAAPLTLDGVTVTPGQGAADGDQWSLAVLGGAVGVSLRPIGPERVAAASHFVWDAGAANTGGGALTVTADAAATAFTAASQYVITITAPGTATVSDTTGTVLATVPADGSSIAGAGFAFSIPATAVTGDTFRITPTSANSQDNGNALALAALRDQAGPGGTVEQSLDATTAGVGSALSETSRLADAATTLARDTAKAADAVTGVDLDTEAADLTRLQTAYRANAQVIAAAKSLFDTLLQATQ